MRKNESMIGMLRVWQFFPEDLKISEIIRAVRSGAQDSERIWDRSVSVIESRLRAYGIPVVLLRRLMKFWKGTESLCSISLDKTSLSDSKAVSDSKSTNVGSNFSNFATNSFFWIT